MTDSLLTRYRPQAFDEVLGQDKAVASLRAAIKGGQGRAFLFTGPSGVGKTTLARITAAKLGCKPEDLVEVDAATRTGVDDMRSVAEGLLYRPLGEGSAKAIVVDECQMLSKSAWNSLLKIIEHPPPWGYWLFCTTEPIKVPDTIRTRCLRYDLKPVSYPILVGLLEVVAELEKMEVCIIPGGHLILELCAKEAEGSPRQALAYLGTCANANSRAEAAEMLRTATDSVQAVDLAKALMNGARWKDVRELLGSLRDTNPESIRHVIRAYMTKVVLDAKSDDAAGRGMELLSIFNEPFNSSDGISPVLVACAQVLWAKR